MDTLKRFPRPKAGRHRSTGKIILTLKGVAIDELCKLVGGLDPARASSVAPMTCACLQGRQTTR
jgi:hypothetical protein